MRARPCRAGPIRHSTNQPTAQGEQRKSNGSPDRGVIGASIRSQSQKLQGLWQGRIAFPLQSDDKPGPRRRCLHKRMASGLCLRPDPRPVSVKHRAIPELTQIEALVEAGGGLLETRVLAEIDAGGNRRLPLYSITLGNPDPRSRRSASSAGASGWSASAPTW